jgi:hypothetical protein
MLALAAAPALAQQPPAIVRVRVVDPTGAPVPNADVATVRGLNTTVARGVTDSAGRRVFTMSRGDDEYQVVVRHIGFDRADQFFRPNQDSLGVVIRLHRTPNELPAMVVTADQDVRRKRYHVGADDIAASTRPIHDGLDVITKLRPDMMEPPDGGIFTTCGAWYLWVNGTRVVFPPIDPALAIKASQQRRGAIAARAAMANRPPQFHGQMRVPVSVQSALETIHPEHIEEINYADCRDTTVVKARAQGAVFVALKPGIAFEPGRGSYVADAAYLSTMNDSIAAAVERPAAPSAEMPLRVLGVFDEITGEPIAGVAVVDSASGTFATTTVTGTVALTFLPPGTSTLIIRKAGYADLKVEVSMSVRATAPITLTLKKP